MGNEKLIPQIQISGIGKVARTIFQNGSVFLEAREHYILFKDSRTMVRVWVRIIMGKWACLPGRVLQSESWVCQCIIC